MDGIDRVFLEERRKDRNKRVAELKAIITYHEELIQYVEENEFPEEIIDDQRQVLGSYEEELEEHIVMLEGINAALYKRETK